MSVAEAETLALRDRDIDNFRRDKTLIRLETETTTLLDALPAAQPTASNSVFYSR